jgi:hypothetical protein
MEKEERWSVQGKVDGQTPRDLCEKLFLALSGSCENSFLKFVESNFLSEENAIKAKNVVFREVDFGVLDFRIIQGMMERKLSSGSFSFRVFSSLKKKFKVFEVNDGIRVGEDSYNIGLSRDDKPILSGQGKFRNYSLRLLLADETDFYRESNNPDMEFIGFMNSLEDETREFFMS